MITLAEIEEALDEGNFLPGQSRAILKAIELSQRREREETSDSVMTKKDGAELKNLIYEAKSEMLKWTVVFWMGLFIPVIAILLKQLN